MTKIDRQLNILLNKVQTSNGNTPLTDDQKSEISKIGFLYSVGRMSPLEVALRLYFVYLKDIDSIYSTTFQDFVKDIR